MTNSELKNLLAVSVFMAGLVASSNLDYTGKQKNLTQFFNFDDVCPQDGTKKEINMKTGMAVFTFNEAVFKTREKLKRRELSCHLELETYPYHGFHVYIEEMNINKNQAGCDDFVQFGRDVLFITNFASYKYCETLPKKELQQQQNQIDDVTSEMTPSGVSRRPRLYIEEKDREMDIWLTIRKSEDGVELPPRNLTLVVTVFKKACGAKDNYFRPCPNTQNCVRREFFCDGYVSCAWPYGEAALDEQKNCEDLRNDLSASSSLFSTANIPVIIIVVIVIVALLVIFFIACNRFIGMVKKPTEGEEDRGLRMPLGQTPQSDSSHADVCLRTFGVAEFSDLHEMSHDLGTRLPSMPPSYDEVVRSGGVQVHTQASRLPSEPPPYSPTTTDI